MNNRKLYFIAALVLALAVSLTACMGSGTDSRNATPGATADYAPNATNDANSGMYDTNSGTANNMNGSAAGGTNNANVLSATENLGEGLKIAWWGMDIAEIRWSWIEACKMNPIGIAASVGYLVLFFAYYIPQMKKEERAAAERMGVEYLEG